MTKTIYLYFFLTALNQHHCPQFSVNCGHVEAQYVLNERKLMMNRSVRHSALLPPLSNDRPTLKNCQQH